MLINLRNALMAGKRLPYDAEVEYIGLNGRLNYISTGLKYFPDFEIDVYVPDGQRHVTITDNTSTRICERISAARPYWQVRAGSMVATTVSVYGRHTVALKSSIFYVDGEATGTLTNRDWSETLNCYLPSANQNGYVMRYYSCKLYDQNGVLVRDFIPVRKGTVGYLYDRVSGKLFGNAGTGDFVLGPDVVPVEYIESHGTEYIDTGVSPYGRTPIIKLDMMARPTTVEKTGYFGAWGANDSRLQIFRGVNTTGSLGVGTYQDVVWRDNVRTAAVLDAQTRSAELYGTAYSNFNIPNGFADYNLYLFWRNNNNGDGTRPGCMRCYACEILDASSPLRSFRPVRVGTDATSWEGAMMDVLTRRIYRNAGTGAFTYGNDLKYPIPAE